MIEIIQMIIIFIIGFIFITGIVRYILQILKQYKTERFGDVNNLEEFVEYYGDSKKGDKNNVSGSIDEISD